MAQQVVFFLPGTMCDQRLWQQTFSCLDASINPIHIDLPLADNFEQIITQIAAQLPNEAIDLVGFSLGGYIAALFAIRYPTRVRRLLISANSPTPLPRFEIIQRHIAIKAIETWGYQGIPLAKIYSFLAQQNKQNQSIIELIKAMDQAGGASKVLSQLKATSRRENLCSSLAILDIPIHFVFGDQDSLVNTNEIDDLQCEQITSQILTNCGHMNPLEAPEQFARQIANFFQ